MHSHIVVTDKKIQTEPLPENPLALKWKAHYTIVLSAEAEGVGSRLDGVASKAPGKDVMRLSRKDFLGASISLAASATALWSAQQGEPGPPFQKPTEPPPEPTRNPRRDQIILKANRQAITKDVARMAELVDDLQKEFKQNDTTEILSLDVLRKSEEIEKLAKHIRDLVRG